MAYKISTAHLRWSLGFENKAGTHWMWEDPNRQIGGKYLYVSIHDPDVDDQDIASFNSVAIKTGEFLQSIGFAVDLRGNLHLGRSSEQRYGSLTKSDKETLADLVCELRGLLRRYAHS